MKIALYIEDGLEQIVLTPESPTEKGILGKLHDGPRSFEMKKGTFYQCAGGWLRHGDKPDESTMIVMRPAQMVPVLDTCPASVTGQHQFEAFSESTASGTVLRAKCNACGAIR